MKDYTRKNLFNHKRKDSKIVGVIEYLDVSPLVSKVFPCFKGETKARRRMMNKILDSLSEAIQNTDKEEKMKYNLLVKELERRGVDKRQYKSLLDDYPILECVDDNYHPSFRDEMGLWIPGKGKLYDLTPEGEKLLELIIREHSLVSKEVMVDRKGMSKLYTIPDKINVKAFDFIDYDYYHRCELNLFNVEEILEMDDYIKNPLLARTIADAIVEGGVLDQFYLRKDKGRLFGVGVSSCQRMPRTIRKALLKGYYEYDIVNAHFVIADHIADPLLDAIHSYANDTTIIRNMLSKDLDMEVSEVKTCLLMLLYGAGVSLRSDSSLVEELGSKERAKKFVEHPFVKQLVEDIGRLHEMMIEQGMINPESEDRWDSRQRSLALQHIEAVMLDACIEHVEPQLLLFDGFVSKECKDVKIFQNAIYERTGMNVTVKRGVI